MHFFSPGHAVAGPAVHVPSLILRQKSVLVRFGDWTTQQLLGIIWELFWLQHSLEGRGHRRALRWAWSWRLPHSPEGRRSAALALISPNRIQRIRTP